MWARDGDGVLSAGPLGTWRTRVLVAAGRLGKLVRFAGACRVRLRFGAIAAKNIGKLLEQTRAAVATIDIKKSRGSIRRIQLTRDPTHVYLDVACKTNGNESANQTDDKMFFASTTGETECHAHVVNKTQNPAPSQLELSTQDLHGPHKSPRLVDKNVLILSRPRTGDHRSPELASKQPHRDLSKV